MNKQPVQGLIRLRHPLPCQLGTIPAQLKALGPNQLHFRWEDQVPADWHKSTPLVLKTWDGISLRVKALSYPSSHEGIFEPLDYGDRLHLTDWLHRIRKDQHIDICDQDDVEASDRDNGFGRIELQAIALPELDWAEIDVSVTFLHHKFQAPFLITGMTGGIDRGAKINLRLAKAAAKFGIPMGVGSQRLALENPKYADIFKVKDTVPDLFLIANLGISQIAPDQPHAPVEKAIEMIEADAIAIHVNILQEVIQEEGDRKFRGMLARIKTICQATKVPVVVKEVGCGIDPRTAKSLIEAGVSAIDIGGKGGTSWAFIEGLRSADPITQGAAKVFRNWGTDTASALQGVRQVDEFIPIIATGGIRDGLMAAKALALGANMVGIGLPLLKAALIDTNSVEQVLHGFVRELKTAMICTGVSQVQQLKDVLKLKE
jgi:isopentenyl-diphosphate delta-isomerase